MLSRNFARLLGLKTLKIDNSKNEEKLLVNPALAEEPIQYPCLWQRNLYLTNENIGYSYANNSVLKILATLHITDPEYGEYTSIEFPSPKYKRWIGPSYVDQIRIDIKDQNGEDIRQNVGENFATLHFRKIKNA